MLLCWQFLMFQKIVSPSTSGSHGVPGLLTAEDEGNMIPCNTITTYPTVQHQIPEDLISSNTAVRTSTVIILRDDQLDALLCFVYVYFTSLHVLSIQVLIIRRFNCINTISGICHSVRLVCRFGRSVQTCTQDGQSDICQI